MRNLVILGAGTAGCIMANRLRKALPPDRWQITVVDRQTSHFYQPGFLYIPFGLYSPSQVVKPAAQFLPQGVRFVNAPIDRISPEENQVLLANGTRISYDYLIVASGSTIRPDQTEGMTGELWGKQIFDFYTLDGASALARFLKRWQGGRLVVNVAEMPIKCPVAPLEFAFLADWYFTRRGIRSKVDIQYVTPLPGAFTRPKASATLGDSLKKRNVRVTPEFSIARVDTAARTIVSWDETTIPFDLLVTIPTNMGDEAVGRSGLGDELNFVPTNKSTLQSTQYANIYVIGDATDLPVSKAGSVAHFQSTVLLTNLLLAAEGAEPTASFDGHANCFLETGYGKGILLDFNYDTEPLPGKFPLPGVGPFSLLRESRMNHLGKLMFRWMYWHLLLRGRHIPIASRMSLAGKETHP